MVALLIAVPLSVSAQLLRENHQQKFPKAIPAGNYSGITALGDDRYAVVNDKSADGFSIFHISIDSLSGRILSVVDEGFMGSGLPNLDQEGIAFQPHTRTLYISGEADNEILEYTLGGQRTGRRFQRSPLFSRLSHNYGLESLCYDADAHLFYTMSEHPAEGDSLLRLMVFDDDGQLVQQYTYALDPVPAKRRGTLSDGVSELCALGDGRLLVLERTVRVPPLKIGSYVECRLYEVCPASEERLQKKHLHTFRTKLNLVRRNFANYEGLCVARRLADGSLILLMIADSQNQYRGILRDWLKTLIVRKGDGL